MRRAITGDDVSHCEQPDTCRFGVPARYTKATRTDEFSSAAEQQKLWRRGRAELRLMRIPSLAYMPATEGA